MIHREEGIVRGTAIMCMALLATGCSGSDAESEGSNTGTTEQRTTESSSPVGTAATASVVSVETSHAATTTVGLSDLVPPADPSDLIGRTALTTQILSNPGIVPAQQLTGPPLLIDGATTNLGSYGGACITSGCEHSVELLADSSTFIDHGWPSASYLTLESQPDRDPSGKVTWTILDVLPISDVPSNSPLSLLTDECAFPGLSDSVRPVATLIDRVNSPNVPTRVWVVDLKLMELSELPVSPAWTCTPFTD